MSFKRRRPRSEAEAELARRIDRIENWLFFALLTLLTIFGTALIAVMLR